MNMPSMTYDIRTAENARWTLTTLTGVPLSVWQQYSHYEDEYEYANDFVADVITSYGNLPNSYQDFTFCYFHVTTSANECASFRKNGILDLKQSYLCCDSELRIFLKHHDIDISLSKQILTYRGQEFNIAFGASPIQDAEVDKRWLVARKFFSDYTTCGFLSIDERLPYGGQVHRRPEILLDIDVLLNLDLSKEWQSTHRAYEIVAKISGENIICDFDAHLSDKDKVLHYLTYAYHTAFGRPSEHVVLMQNNVQIPPLDILEINPFVHWQTINFDTQKSNVPAKFK